jgi:hypothetical protein
MPRIIQTAESKTFNSNMSRPSASKNSGNSDSKKY